MNSGDRVAAFDKLSPNGGGICNERFDTSVRTGEGVRNEGFDKLSPNGFQEHVSHNTRSG